MLFNGVLFNYFLQPELPAGACCLICNTAPAEETSNENVLMECGICWKIVHPKCHKEKYNISTEGVINEDLPNSWECPKCVEEGKHGQLKVSVSHSLLKACRQHVLDILCYILNDSRFSKKVALVHVDVFYI